MRKKTVIISLVLVLFVGIPNIGRAASESLDILDIAASAETCLLYGYSCVPFGCMVSVFPPIPGDFICNNVPVALVETVTGPGQTVIPFIGTALSLLGQSAGMGSGGASSHNDKDNLQYFESHVFDLPIYPILEFMNPFLRMCPTTSGMTWMVNYLSEVDPIGWKSGVTDYIYISTMIGSALASITSICSVAGTASSVLSQLGISLTDVCMGTWGVTYPRTGFSNTYSEPVASGIAAYRASRVVANPLLRVVFVPDPLLSANPIMQLAYPFSGTPLSCFGVGTTPAAWDNLDTKLPKGTGYLWILWDKTCCCLPSTGCL
jgi:hypothetical protein